jgi:hypothetical protein
VQHKKVGVFLRRKMQLFCVAPRGTITRLAKEYFISRTFVYMLAKSLMDQSQIKFADYCTPVLQEKSYLEHILFLRLEGKCSIETISSYLKRFGFDNSSTGYISQILNDIGSELSNTQSFNEGDEIKVIFASDEIFAKKAPIIAEVILEELQAKKPELSKEVLEAVCLDWQWGKKKVKTKESNRKKYCAAKEKY